MPLFTRGGTVEVESISLPEKFRGKIGCYRNIRCNVLLPSGDVLLCSTDWEMKHVLGNLYVVDYKDLFKGNEFKCVDAGMNDEDADVLCRYCESHTYDVNLISKVKNIKQRMKIKLNYLKLYK